MTTITAQEILKWVEDYVDRLTDDEDERLVLGGWIVMKVLEAELLAAGRNGEGVVDLQAHDFFTQYMDNPEEVRQQMQLPGLNTPLDAEVWDAVRQSLEGDGMNGLAVYTRLNPSLPAGEQLGHQELPADAQLFISKRLISQPTMKDLQLLEDADGVVTLVRTPGYSLEIVLDPNLLQTGWPQLRSRVGRVENIWSMLDLGYRYALVVETQGRQSRLGLVGKTGVFWALDDSGEPQTRPEMITGVDPEIGGSHLLTQVLIKLRPLACEQWRKAVETEFKGQKVVWSQRRRVGVELPLGEPMTVLLPLPAASRYRDSVLDRVLTLLSITLPELGKTMLRDSFLDQCSICLGDYADDPVSLMDAETEKAIHEAGLNGRSTVAVLRDVYTEILEDVYAKTLKPWKHTVLEALGAEQVGDVVKITIGKWQTGRDGQPDPEVLQLLAQLEGQHEDRAFIALLPFLQRQVPDIHDLNPIKWWRIDRQAFNAKVRTRCRQ